MGSAMKYFSTKLLGHEIFISMISWATNFFWKISKTLWPSSYILNIHFLSVKLSDYSSLRFLWGDTPKKNSKVETHQMLVHIIGETGSPCCFNFAVKTLARDNLENHWAMTIKTVLRSCWRFVKIGYIRTRGC